jgi:adenylate cyclase
MACFSTPLPTERDATNALSRALAMQAAVADWNRERREAGSDPIAAAVGLHYGPVLLGTIGDERRLELATIGDTVNITSRLEALARPLEASIVISDAMVRRVREERSGGEALLRGFRRHDGQRLRGLDDTVTVWALHRAAFE